MPEKIPYDFEDHEATLAQILASGKRCGKDNLTNLDENGRPKNCFFMVESMPEQEEQK